jgi:hypothetical protein
MEREEMMPRIEPAPMRDFHTTAEMREYHRDVHARMWSPPPPKPPEPEPPLKWPEPTDATFRKADRVLAGELINIHVPPRVILAFVSQERGVDVLTKDRIRKVAQARAEAIWLMRALLQRSLNFIGNCIERDHATVVHHCQRTLARIGEDGAYRAQMRELIAKLIARYDKEE